MGPHARSTDNSRSKWVKPWRTRPSRSPVGPLLAIATDESVPEERRVDPHHWADEVRSHGWMLQLQPGLNQSFGVTLPHTTHLTITPVTESVMAGLADALMSAAGAVRGVPPVSADDALASLPEGLLDSLTRPLESESALRVLTEVGLVATDSSGLPEKMAPFLALITALPAPVTERLLTELIARTIE